MKIVKLLQQNQQILKFSIQRKGGKKIKSEKNGAIVCVAQKKISKTNAKD